MLLFLGELRFSCSAFTWFPRVRFLPFPSVHIFFQILASGLLLPHCFAKARCIHHFFAFTRVEQHEPAVFPSSRERNDTDPDQARTTPARRFPTGIVRSSASVSPLCANSRKMTTIEHHVCEWSHIYDESEWSLMTTLIRRFGVPYE